MIRFLELSKKSLIILLVIIVILVNAVGISLYSTSYFPNFIADFGGIFTAILIGLIFIDEFNRIQRIKKWKKIENLTLDSLTINLQEFFNEAFIYFNYTGMDVSPTTPKWKDIDTESVNDLEKWIEDLRDNSDTIVDPTKETISDKVVQWYEATNDSLLTIRNVLFPRIFDISEYNELVDSLIDFDSDMMALEINIKGFNEMRHISLFPIFINSIIKIQIIFKLIANRNKQK